MRGHSGDHEGRELGLSPLAFRALIHAPSEALPRAPIGREEVAKASTRPKAAEGSQPSVERRSICSAAELKAGTVKS